MRAYMSSSLCVQRWGETQAQRKHQVREPGFMGSLSALGRGIDVRLRGKDLGSGFGAISGVMSMDMDSAVGYLMVFRF